MSFIRKLKKSIQDEMVASTTRAGGSHSNNNPYKGSSSSHPPPYAPVAPAGEAASYYGNTAQPQYPPVQPNMQYQQAPFPPQNQYPPQMPPPQQQYPIHNGPPNPLIRPGTLPLPSMNPTMGADDPYTFLREYDTVLLIDDSGSMSGGRWKQTAAALSTIVPIVTFYDVDGVDLHFINAPDDDRHHNIRTTEQVMRIFGTVKPQGATPTGRALKRILDPYMASFERHRSEVKPINIIVITDGVPTDDVESTIVKYARKLDKLDADLTQVGIQFFQIGEDPEATEALRELDDELGNMKDVRDMVDTAPWKGSLKGDEMLKVVLGAVNRRLDRKRI